MVVAAQRFNGAVEEPIRFVLDIGGSVYLSAVCHRAN